MNKTFYPGSWQQQRAFSPLVETRGGRMLWVAGHGGLIDFESEPGRTVFRVLLPIASPEDLPA